jgi:hypothetical protein
MKHFTARSVATAEDETSLEFIIPRIECQPGKAALRGPFIQAESDNTVC